MASGGEALGPSLAGWCWLTVSPGVAVRQSVSQGWSHPRACWGGVSFQGGSLTRGEPVLALGQDPPLLSRWAVRGAASVSVQKARDHGGSSSAFCGRASGATHSRGRLQPTAAPTVGSGEGPRKAGQWRGDTGAMLEAGYQNQFGNISEILLGTFRNKL